MWFSDIQNGCHAAGILDLMEKSITPAERTLKCVQIKYINPKLHMNSFRVKTQNVFFVHSKCYFKIRHTGASY
jgi:hypothetical protein